MSAKKMKQLRKHLNIAGKSEQYRRVFPVYNPIGYSHDPFAGLCPISTTPYVAYYGTGQIINNLQTIVYNRAKAKVFGK